MSAAKYSTSWTSQTSVTVTHNLGTTAVLMQVQRAFVHAAACSDSITPENVQIVDANNVQLTFGAAFNGYVVIVGIGSTPTAQSYTTSWVHRPRVP